MNITYFDLLDLLDDDIERSLSREKPIDLLDEDFDHFDTIFLGFQSPLPQDHEDHGTDCMNFWKDRI